MFLEKKLGYTKIKILIYDEFDFGPVIALLVRLSTCRDLKFYQPVLKIG